MEIKLNANYTLTTEHPASHYGAGVLVDTAGNAYGPVGRVPGSNDFAKKLFGAEIPPLEAGELVSSYARNNRISADELALIRRYLSQDPQGRFNLEDDEVEQGMVLTCQTFVTSESGTYDFDKTSKPMSSIIPKGAKWIKETIKIGKPYVVFGKVNFYNGNFSIAHPEMELLSLYDKGMKAAIQPVYPSTEKLSTRGVTNKVLCTIMEHLFKDYYHNISESLSLNILKKH